LLPPPSPPALSLPSGRKPVVGTVFRRPSGTARRSLICWVIGRSFSRSPAYRLRGTRQTSTGKVQQTSWPSRRLYVRISDENWALLLGASSPDAAASAALRLCSKRSRTYDFHQTSPRGPSVAWPWAMPAERTWCSRSTPLSLRCRVPSVRAPGWTHTSCLLTMPFATPRPPSRRPRCRGRLSQNRACAFHTRLVGTAGCYPHRRPVHDPSAPSKLGAGSFTGSAVGPVGREGVS
jgi:hypothetical protein